MSNLIAQLQTLSDSIKAKRAAEVAIINAQHRAKLAAMPAPVVAPADALKARMSAIEAQCRGWKSCQDGSYERAMSDTGYYRLQAQLEALEGVTA